MKPGVPAGQRVYAVGDIHGRADLLDGMRQSIAEDLEEFPINAPAIVFLGDYVDRGPDSRVVLDRLTASPFPARIVPLRGNHEAMLLQFLNNPETLTTWRHNGGLETLYSYGLDVREVRLGRGYEEAAYELRKLIPAAHLEFLRATPLSFTSGDYFFCHAGVRPEIDLTEQTEEDLLWIREEFTASERDFGKVVIHGHTPVSEPEIHHNRINIDTGAYISNRLTCLVLEDDRQRFLTPSWPPGKARPKALPSVCKRI
ncbi:metallophosphoesterase family protein [Microvirga massiliensis]|uniref:metallophosphoesterase family protein n=1 Tax=Microvirga massiliensis TaxID=1033741 RepID=UPI00062BCCDB|nr:metallophosphoesterase family protein [Microvirga massiliensis]